jgi:type I restriction enzyme, S subunit
LNDGGVWGADPDGVDDTVVVRSTDQTADGRWRPTEPALRRLTASEKHASRLFTGDLVVTKSSGSSLHIGKTTLVTDDIASLGCCYSNFMQRLRLKSLLNPKFAWYVLNSGIARIQLDLLSNSTTGLANLNGATIGKVVLAVPPVVEQLVLTEFLDDETAKIDTLVAEQERLIELLEEKRQAVISRAVTEGLDTSVAMKASGNDWLPHVPHHWRVMRFQRCVFVAEGQVDPKSADFSTMKLIAPDYIESGTGRLLPLETAEDQGAISGKYLCRRGEVVYSKIRPALRKVCIAPEDCLCSADMYPLHAQNGLENEFLFWVILSEQFSAFSVLESERVAMPKINRGSLKKVVLALPPVPEQIAIVGYIKSETQRIDGLIVEAKKAVGLLLERRSSLISAVVTGQIDARQPEVA